ncbi:MAG: hypothetical protein SOV85_16365 [Clostridium sp.]|uniref:hypothetical protein n=1 Tax=Clostridium sp. TaxID=1506 RepID=UPI002A75CD2A|nr:hypothetical protein [Clostridium sp.]MDY2632898.1 hypothetical protein [Clostridium sp.]
MNLGDKNKKSFEKKFENSSKALVTIKSFYEEIDRTLNSENYGTLIGYRYIVSFIDDEGEERIEASEKFLEKLLLNKGQKVMAYYIKSDKSDAIAFKKYDYEILFCDKEIYKLEKESDAKSKKLFLFGKLVLLL